MDVESYYLTAKPLSPEFVLREMINHVYITLLSRQRQIDTKT